MVSQQGESSEYNVACSVSQAYDQQIIVRVMNPSNFALEFTANQLNSCQLVS